MRLSGRPWGEVWALAEVATRDEAELGEARAVAEAWWAWSYEQYSRSKDTFGRRIVDELEAETLESSDIGTSEVRAQAEAEALAVALAGVWGWARSDARARGESVPSALADSSTIRRILTILNRSGLANLFWHHSPETTEEYSCITHFISPITRLPSELLHQIFLIVVENMSDPPLALMLVCKHWHAIVTGIWAAINLGTRTPIKAVTNTLERSQWLLDIVVDTESDRGYSIPSHGAFGAVFVAMEASSRWRSLIVKSCPAQADLPEDIVNRCLQWRYNTIMTRFTALRIDSACGTSPLLNTLLSILGTGTIASSALTTVEIKSPHAISFLAPAYPSMFHSVKVLTLDTPGIPNPVDLLPHLHQLESFNASHISLPVYDHGTDLPLVRTLRRLSLKAVSIQWMSGRTFHILEYCTIIFPLHRQVLHTFKAVLPNCKHLTFRGAPLDILNNISAKKLIHLSVTCSSSFGRCGARQLVRLSQGFRKSQLTPNILHFGIEAASRAWIYALAFLPALEELVIHSPRPSSLGAKVFRSLIVLLVGSNNSGATSTLGRPNTPLLPLLQRFVLKYGRWLRRSEQFDLIPVLMSIIRSRQHLNVSLKSFGLLMRSDQNDPLELIGRFGVDAL